MKAGVTSLQAEWKDIKIPSDRYYLLLLACVLAALAVVLVLRGADESFVLPDQS